ncbi:hypothetical protein N657DRAFT_650880 [Parathielavia appendiculata]|uniref:Uncharacterized protein n=1 Tax=Parathielavia appendiculata TaxID=2587402 RepID=A0AAN6TRH8_9PEZI|nr:hypothetical protein N657DRAFT_650880 [Parathielavia appendiculata]
MASFLENARPDHLLCRPPRCRHIVELSGFLGTKIHGLSTDVQCETLSQHRSITMTQFLT